MTQGLTTPVHQSCARFNICKKVLANCTFTEREYIHTCIKSGRLGIFQTRRSKISPLLSTDVLEMRLCLNPLAGHCVIKMHCCLQVGNFTNLHIEPNMELDCLNVYGQVMIPPALDLHLFFLPWRKIFIQHLYAYLEAYYIVLTWLRWRDNSIG